MLGCRYVEQNDIHSPQVTVGESLMFSAQLRLMDVQKHDLTLFVDEVSMPSCACLPCRPSHLLTTTTWSLAQDSL